MIDLKIKIVDREAIVHFGQVAVRVQDLLEMKMQNLIEHLRLKVDENLSGKVLQTKSGALRTAVISGVDKVGSALVGYVDIDPSDPKVEAYALAHEYGGKGHYEILPVNKAILRFVGKSGEIVRTPYVYHPPALERSFIRSALHEEEPYILSGMEEALREALSP